MFNSMIIYYYYNSYYLFRCDKTSDPHWASINLGVTLCKQCAGKSPQPLSQVVGGGRIKNN